MNNYLKDPKEIERRSFEIITDELGEKKFGESMGRIVKRVIHATADFEYADLLEIHPEAIEAGKKAIEDGCCIYSDTQMIIGGVNKKSLSKFGVCMFNFVHDEDVAKKALETGITRSMIALEKAALDKNIRIFAVGNAPTALFTLKRLIEEGKTKPDLIIGVPVGFVGAAESKESIRDLGIPYIITRGRKGGSTVAAAIINALLYMV